MKNVTISDLATILQLDNTVKENLVKNFPEYSPGLKEKIVKILWDYVFELKERLAKLKYDEFLLEVDEGKRELTEDLYKQAVKAVWQDLDDIVSGRNKDTQLIESIRAQITPLIQDKVISPPPKP